MSNEYVKSTLFGYQQIGFSQGISALNYAYNLRNRLDERDMRRILNRLGFDLWNEILNPITFDEDNRHYDWFHAMKYRVGIPVISSVLRHLPHGEIVVLFPYMRDTSLKDGTRLDRSIAVYKRGRNLEPIHANKVIDAVHHRMVVTRIKKPKSAS